MTGLVPVIHAVPVRMLRKRPGCGAAWMAGSRSGHDNVSVCRQAESRPALTNPPFARSFPPRNGGHAMTIGLRVLQRRRAVDAATVEAFRSVPVANVSDCMSRMTAGGARLRPLHGGGVLSGPALTVKTRPGDNLMIHKAIAMGQPGDVIVVDGGGDLTNALIGEIMVSEAIAAGIAGFVIDGAIRDLGAIRAGHFPVYAAGRHPSRPL